MVKIKTLLPELRNLVGELAEDLLARSTENADIDAGLRKAFQQIEKGGRTAQAFEVWRTDYLDQVAVAWVLACVFVRFMEDNRLIDECWLAGEGERRKLAEGSHELFFRQHAHDTDREYFQHVFHEVGKIPAAADLFAEGKTPLWAVAPSGDAAMKLLRFWREEVEDMDNPPLKRSFEVENGDTRFLGDLYQDLSEKARKKYALLQTPVFVEEFILDRTLTPALDEFGLDKVRMIDPTCGSGHFLLGGFARLFREWCKVEGNEIKAAQKALDGVWGVDINPFAVAIARFRLIVAAVQACGIRRLKDAAKWTIHLATGDSLLFGSRPGWKGERVPLDRQASLFEVDPIYAVENPAALKEILNQGYHVVVGNPPYITVKDKAQNEAYRGLYSTCHRQYSLGVPFTQRLWELAIQQGEANGGGGYIGQITANSFMKRQFGKKLIEEYFPKVDLTHIIDASGAYIPGHGTPTVILLGRARKPVSESVRGVLGIKGESSAPDEPSEGRVWKSIVSRIDQIGTQDEYTSTEDIARSVLCSHPWSIGGGGATDLQEYLNEQGASELGTQIAEIGFGALTRDDDVFLLSRRVALRHGVEEQYVRNYNTGENIRDWSAVHVESALWPYNPDSLSSELSPAAMRCFWLFKRQLCDRVAYGLSQLERGLQWYEYSMFFKERYRTARQIAFATVATHNHFVLFEGQNLFNSHAPILILPPQSTKDEFLGLLGLLNSSTACFWMKQTFHNRGGQGVNEGAKAEHWEKFYEHNGTGLMRFPVSEHPPANLAGQIAYLASIYTTLTPEETVRNATPTHQSLDKSRSQAVTIRGRLIAQQEELDWQCYRLYGLLPDDLHYTGDDLPELALGQRAFEIVMARQIAKGELQTAWFERHGSTPITEIPMHWPAAYRKLVERRIKLIESNKEIGLIEKPEYKRRWNTEPWAEQEQRALKHWLLDRLEDKRFWPSIELQSTARLADRASTDAEFMQVAALYRGRSDFDVAALVAELVEAESVPFLPVLRYKATGLRKRAVWERTWDLQREEDRLGEKVDQLRQQLELHQMEHGDQPPADIERMLDLIRRDIHLQEQVRKEFAASIPVPPKYATADFQKTDYWRLRGKLDVPKERWVSFPHCHTDSDPSLLVGWAGWNHLQQVEALVGYYDARKREGWDAKRLTPLLAGLDQLLPWVHQWHPEIPEGFDEPLGKSYETLLGQDAPELGLTLEDIRNWQPPATTTRRRARK